jgi:hypothetical protein
MRGALKYGVPIAAGLGVGGYALSQGEDPGSAALAAGAGLLGGAAGLKGARDIALAGKYGGQLSQQAQGLLGRAEDRLSRASYGAKNDLVSDALLNLSGAAGNVANRITPRNIGKAMAAGAVPAAALTAGLGGMALGAIPGSMGVPGFQQGMAIDPESPGSSNTASAKYGVTPYASTQYM